MAPFSMTNQGDVTLWRGNPDCESAHSDFLAWLTHNQAPFLQGMVPLNERQKGNIGETLAFFVGHTYVFQQLRVFPANAFAPLSNIAKPDIDIIWIFLGNTPVDDFMHLQEVKTTGDSHLSIARRLVDDYDKLFGVDINLTLQTRIQSLKNEFEYKLQLPHMCQRLTRLAGNSPQTCSQIRVIPTLIHDLTSVDPIPKLTLVRNTLVGKGWPGPSILPWSIALSDLESRLSRLARGAA